MWADVAYLHESIQTLKSSVAETASDRAINRVVWTWNLHSRCQAITHLRTRAPMIMRHITKALRYIHSSAAWYIWGLWENRETGRWQVQLPLRAVITYCQLVSTYGNQAATRGQAHVVFRFSVCLGRRVQILSNSKLYNNIYPVGKHWEKEKILCMLRCVDLGWISTGKKSKLVFIKVDLYRFTRINSGKQQTIHYNSHNGNNN